MGGGRAWACIGSLLNTLIYKMQAIGKAKGRRAIGR